MIRRIRGSSIKDLKLKKKEEEGRYCHEVQIITTGLI
jgi:hypothetical protein